MSSARTVVRTFYPADPVGVVPGGVDTFIRGLIKWAPQDLDFELVGMTTDADARPIGEWTSCDLGRRRFAFLPVVAVGDAGGRARVPLSIRFMAGMARYWRGLRAGFDVFEFHRIEPALAFLSDARPKNAFFHQDMGVIRTEAKADILWRRWPGLYFSLEAKVVGSLSSAWCVREEGVRALQQRNPAKGEVIRFVPTWVDTEVFSPLTESDRERERQRLAGITELDPRSTWIVSVGRLDLQKDPQMLLDAVGRRLAVGDDLAWLVIGDGVLRGPLEAMAARDGLSSRLAFLGLQPPREIARIVAASDVYALSSAYEGMPMALLEALASGIPAVTTDVGEVRRVVKPGLNGQISAERTPEAFSAALGQTIAMRRQWGGEHAVEAITAYRPQQVLQAVYDNYRELGHRRSVG